MKKEEKLKRYFVTITWYPEYAATYDDVFDIWAHNKNEVNKLLTSYYNTNMIKTAEIKIYYRFINTLWCRLTKKVADKPVIEHL